MSSLKQSSIPISMNQTNEKQLAYQNVRNHLQILEFDYDGINEQITANLKFFDEIVGNDKETYEKIRRNLEDIRTIFTNDLDKFEETVDKSIQYNQALYGRLEKDAHYLREDQESLRKKMFQMDKRVTEMQEQIGGGF